MVLVLVLSTPVQKSKNNSDSRNIRDAAKTKGANRRDIAVLSLPKSLVTGKRLAPTLATDHSAMPISTLRKCEECAKTAHSREKTNTREKL